MTENSTLPNTDLEVVEQYSPGKRLNYPNFGSVYKSSFAKGVITDFEVVRTDPFQVKSMVKVSGDWGESDYIPLFYHPKEGYWDDSEVLATDFNAEGGYFERAWMSFRVGDEVNVLLSSNNYDEPLIPKAVVGFYDGVPRVGEDVFKLKMAYRSGASLGVPNPYYISVVKAQKTIRPFWSDKNPEFPDDNFTIPDIGPDGLDLGLEKEAELATSATENILVSSYSLYYGSYEWTNPDYPGCIYYNYNENLHAAKLNVWVVVVGPILYAIYVSCLKASATQTWYRTVDRSNWSQEVLDAWTNFPWEFLKYGTPEEPIWPFVQAGDDSPYPGGIITEGEDHFWEFYLEIKAGLYTEELYNKVLGSINDAGSPIKACGITVDDDGNIVFSGPDYSAGDDICPGAPAELKIQLGLSYFLGDVYRSDLYYPEFACPEDFSWLMRPHTKEELQTAGMWPKKE